MKILLTNDDGINAPGIKALAKRFSGEHEVYIVAPSSNRSAASCCMTVGKNQGLEKIMSCDLPSVAAYGLDGTPVDCALCGLAGNHIPDVDVVISGINNGPNVGTDVIYSGTCGAARQASLYGIPGIALSVDTTSPREKGDGTMDLYYDSLADFAFKNLGSLMELCGERRKYGDHWIYDCFVNVNSPLRKVYRGAKLANPCMRRYFDKIEINENADGTMTSTLVGEAGIFSYGDESADFKVTGEGFVSVSSIYAETKALDLRGKSCSFVL